MSQSPATQPARDRLSCWFRSGDTLRSRSVADAVPWATLDLPAAPGSLVADWEQETAALDLEPGEVEPLPLDLALWPGYASGMRATSDWTGALGLRNLLARTQVDLMSCRGAKYHHDAARYGRAAFCNLFLSADKGLDLHFPETGCRIPLRQGTSVIFDTGQPHAVVRHGRSSFDAADFAAGQDCTLVFLTWELPIEDAAVAGALGIRFDVEAVDAGPMAEQQLRRNGAPARLCPESGRWVRAD
jgi:hypothetical protein